MERRKGISMEIDRLEKTSKHGKKVIEKEVTPLPPRKWRLDSK
jgi:hypothetical protein